MSDTGSSNDSGLIGGRITAAPGPLVLVVAGLAHLALAQLVLTRHDPATSGVPLWPAAGLGLAALLLLPTDRWTWALGGIALAELGGDLSWGHSAGAALGWTASSTAEPLISALLLRRFGNPSGALVPVRQLLMFLVLGAVVGPAAGSTLWATVSASTGVSAFSQVWPGSFLGHALGVLVFAPVLLAPRGGLSRSRREVAALLLSTTFVSALVFTDFGGSWMVTMPYVLVPFFAWAALRFGTIGTAWTSLGVTALAAGFTAAGLGPFAQAGGHEGTAVTLLQVFLAITVSFSLLLAALVSDLTERREIEDALRYQATHDTLTRLPNRNRFAEAIDLALGEPAATGRGTGLLVCDLDHFKAVNDRVGHKGGDELLVQVADRLQEGVRPEDLVARMSGDEFVVLLTDVDADAAHRVARRLVEEVARPVLVDGRRQVRPSISIGAAVAEPGESADSLFRAADAALYQAKKGGRGRVVVVDEALRRHAQTQVRVEDEMPGAFAHGQIVCHFQPVVDLATGHLAAAEATVRWRHPELGLLDAERFLPSVEAMGWGDRLFETVLAQSLQAQRDWAGQAGSHPRVSVNISPLQLSNRSVVSVVLTALADHDAPAEALSVEVSTARHLDDMGVAALHQLNALGVHLVLDGFGTAWSSMDRLAKVPWELLKIDRSFTADLGNDPAAAGVVRAMVAMADALGIRTGADGVARKAQLETLVELGCDVAQGPLFSRADTADEISRLLAIDDGQSRTSILPTLAPRCMSKNASTAWSSPST
jgi:diguanylate cyclase (GGDEF)-like protein